MILIASCRNNKVPPVRVERVPRRPVVNVARGEAREVAAPALAAIQPVGDQFAVPVVGLPHRQDFADAIAVYVGGGHPVALCAAGPPPEPFQMPVRRAGRPPGGDVLQ